MLKFIIFLLKKNPILKQALIDVYQNLVKDEFLITEKIVHVKKGKKRYRLIYFATIDSLYRVDIGRHKSCIKITLDDKILH